MSKIQNEGFKSVAELEATGLDNFTAKTKMLSDEKVYVGGDINKLLSDAIADGDIGGGGVGGINYLPDVTDAEDPNVLENWATSEIGIQFVRNTTNPLRGSADYELNVENATLGTPGQISTEFTIDNADVGGRLLTITFDMRVNEWYTNDLAQIRIQEVTSGGIISVIGGDISGNESTKIAQFYTGATETNYRFIIAFDKDDDANPPAKLFFDNLILGPREVPKAQGPTEWSLIFDNSLDENEFLNEGGTFTLITNPATGLYRIYYVESKFPSLPLVQIKANIADVVGGAENRFEGFGSDANGSFVNVRLLANSSSVNLTGTDQLQITLKQKQEDVTAYRIATDLGNREIAFRGEGVPLGGNAEDPIIYTPVNNDAGAYSDGVFTSPIDGWYDIDASFQTGGTGAVTFYAYIDGVQGDVVSATTGVSTRKIKGLVYLKRNQTLYISTPIAFASSTNVQTAYLTIAKKGNDSPIIAPPTAQIAIFKDVKPSGVDAGTFTAGSYVTRELNTHEGLKTFASLNSNQITLEKGKYLIEAFAPAFIVNNHKLKIRNISDSVDAIIGQTAVAAGTSGLSTSPATLTGLIEINESKVFEIQHICQTSRSTDGLGRAFPFGDNEVYTVVKIQKIY